MPEEYDKEIASFNQASYSQIRLHELFSRIDMLSINPLFFNDEFNTNNFEIIFRDLCSVFSTISSKFTDEDIEDVMELIDEARKLMSNKPVFISIKKIRDYKTIPKIKFKKENWDEIGKKIFELRMKLEKLMDTYGFGNPSKEYHPSKKYNK